MLIMLRLRTFIKFNGANQNCDHAILVEYAFQKDFLPKYCNFSETRFPKRISLFVQLQTISFLTMTAAQKDFEAAIGQKYNKLKTVNHFMSLILDAYKGKEEQLLSYVKCTIQKI